MEKKKIGMVGCGVISEIYLKTLVEVSELTEVVAVYDVMESNAKLRAEQFGIKKVCTSYEELLAMPEIDIVVILTQPGSHYELCKKALLAGKHTYVEKPLALEVSQGAELVRLSKEKGLELCAAPDTILGGGVQTARKLIEDGWIGEPKTCFTHLITGGPESWHPNPAFLYHKGAGPLYDAAVYYVAGIAYLLGEVESAYGMGRITYKERMITSQPRYGEMINVEVPTDMFAFMKIKGGVMALIHDSYDFPSTTQKQQLEILGTEGTLVVPVVDQFFGEALVKRNHDTEWTKIPPVFPYCKNNSRGVGVIDMAAALIEGRKPRLSADLVQHTLAVMEAVSMSIEDGMPHKVEYGFEQTPLMNMGVREGLI